MRSARGGSARARTLSIWLGALLGTCVLGIWLLLALTPVGPDDWDEAGQSAVASSLQQEYLNRKLALLGPDPNDGFNASGLPRLESGSLPEHRSARGFQPNTDPKYRIYSLDGPDGSPRCRTVGICDGDYSCGMDGLGCVTHAAERREYIRQAARWTWIGYRKYAWGQDEVDAQNRRPRTWFNVGLTIVDSIDTLLILGLEDEYQEARQWVANHLDLTMRSVSVFESTIRILGGLLSAFHHSGGDELFLRHAVEFAERMLPAFQTRTGVAISHFTFPALHNSPPPSPSPSPPDSTWMPPGSAGTLTNPYHPISERLYPVGQTNLAEAGTLSMEFSQVSHLIGRPEFREAGMMFWYNLMYLPTFDGLYCTFFDGDSLNCGGYHYTLGAAADSAYEYMLKQWILSSGEDELCLDFYKRAMHGLRKHMLTNVRVVESGNNLDYVTPGQAAEPPASASGASRGADSDTQSDAFKQRHSREMLVVGDVDLYEVYAPGVDRGTFEIQHKRMTVEHLTCFVPGMLALGHIYGQRTTAADVHAPAFSKIRRIGEPPASPASDSAQGGDTHSSSPPPPFPEDEDDDLMVAVRLARACYELYTRAPSGVAFDTAIFSPIFPSPPPQPPWPPMPPHFPPRPPMPPRPPAPPPRPPPFPPLPPGAHTYVYINGRGYVDPYTNRLIDPWTGQYIGDPPGSVSQTAVADPMDRRARRAVQPPPPMTSEEVAAQMEREAIQKRVEWEQRQSIGAANAHLHTVMDRPTTTSRMPLATRDPSELPDNQQSDAAQVHRQLMAGSMSAEMESMVVEAGSEGTQAQGSSGSGPAGKQASVLVLDMEERHLRHHSIVHNDSSAASEMLAGFSKAGGKQQAAQHSSQGSSRPQHQPLSGRVDRLLAAGSVSQAVETAGRQQISRQGGSQKPQPAQATDRSHASPAAWLATHLRRLQRRIVFAARYQAARMGMALQAAVESVLGRGQGEQSPHSSADQQAAPGLSVSSRQPRQQQQKQRRLEMGGAHASTSRAERRQLQQGEEQANPVTQGTGQYSGGQSTADVLRTADVLQQGSTSDAGQGQGQAPVDNDPTVLLSSLHTSSEAAARTPAGLPPPPHPPPSPPRPPSPRPPPPPPPPPPTNYSELYYSWTPSSIANWLRPEVVESLFYLFRATGDPVYREWGWNMFRAYEAFAKLPTGGYTVMSRVDLMPPVPGDKMESFWLAETLKYFYLLFSEPDVIPLDQYVLNTEAHPLPRWGSDADKQMLEVLRKAELLRGDTKSSRMREAQSKRSSSGRRSKTDGSTSPEAGQRQQKL